jgi:hypothetical protein
MRVADRTTVDPPFHLIWGKAGLGPSCAAIALPIQVLVELERQKTPLRRRFIRSRCFSHASIYSCAPLLWGGTFLF